MALTGQVSYEMATADAVQDDVEAQDVLLASHSKGQIVKPRGKDAFDSLKYMRSLRPISIAKAGWLYEDEQCTEAVLADAIETDFGQTEEDIANASYDIHHDVAEVVNKLSTITELPKATETIPSWRIEAKQNVFAYASAKLMKYEAFLDQMARKQKRY
jgi:hypothetical protein